MTNKPPARLFTTFGTALYLDPSGELRHGPIDSSPDNAALVADKGAVGLAAKDGSLLTRLDVVPLERGMFALTTAGRFVCAEPDGRVSLSRTGCSLWECFLASEGWCGAPSEISAAKMPVANDPRVDWKRVRECIVHPQLRAMTGLRPPRARILIYGYPRWSHGRVYYDVGKRLMNEGFVVDIINWQDNHAGYFKSLLEYYDFCITSPDGVQNLHNSYRVPYEQMIVVSHAELDIRMLINEAGTEVFERFAAYGAVSSNIYCASIFQGVARPPMVVSLGVDFDEFQAEPATRLETVGYTSTMSNVILGVDVKRGYLAEAAAGQAGLAFEVAGSTSDQTSFHDMPAFYRRVEAILTTSISEGAGLPVMEAAAAGRLAIGTPVGHFPLKAYQGAGIVAPIEPDKFVAFASETLRYYRREPSAFFDKCCAVQEAARSFDWKFVLPEWIALLDSAGRS